MAAEGRTGTPPIRLGLRALTVAGLLAAALAAGPAHGAGDLLLRGPDGGVGTLAAALPRLRAARVLVVAEDHGVYSQHAGQIDLLRALLADRAPLAVGMEAFPPAAGDQLAAWSSGAFDSADLFSLFNSRWEPETWPAYRDLLFFLREQRIPLFGIDDGRALIYRVSRAGRRALTAEESRQFALPDCGDRLAAVDVSGLPDQERRAALCDAALLRDALMSSELAGLARTRPGELVVALVGRFHADPAGVPGRLAAAGLGPVLTLVPPPQGARAPPAGAAQVWDLR